jgi:hypothetical protein
MPSIQRVTMALAVFTTNTRRARAFLEIFDHPGGVQRGRGRPSDNEKELLRAAVVFAVAALDAYLHDLVLEEVPKRGVHSDTLSEALRSIAKDDPALALRVALVDDKKERHAEFRAALDGWLSAKAFQGPEAVLRALSYVGHPRSASQLGAELGADWARELAAWTDMRHRMVHRGETPYVRRADAGECVDLVTKVADTVDVIALGQ